ncbi:MULTISPECIES: hypothetical protein [Burkholderia cepacia complex]|uniref:hypothetical protein n=1 Tax=Burkholderia cepacia complex TaxID=87882 RepID=UPI001590C12D|nr:MULTISPECIES: hypothetical protein [Burkholderia cepacia complex]MBU9546842.1 hypothetical protein [Burkholderia multivorans]MBY4754891.1 hypothetical protein [Burkholderia dolosa]
MGEIASIVFPSSKIDRVDRDIDPVVLENSLTKHSPFRFSGLLMSAMQALISACQLLRHRPVYVYPKALAEAPHA